MAYTAIASHRDAVERQVPANKEIWITVKSPLKYTGLYLRINKAGGRSWYYRFGMAGKQRRVFLGNIDDVFLEEAATEHAGLVKEVKSGVDVVTVRQIEAEELKLKAAAPVAGITVKQLCNRWLKEYAEVNVKKCSYKDASGRLYKYLIQRWGQLQADSITPAHVIELRDEILSDGHPALSNSVLGLVKQLFSWGVEELLIPSNPAREIKRRGKCLPRSTAWSDEQIKTIWEGVGAFNKPSELAIKLLLLTGCRRTEITSLEISEVTIDEKTRTGVISLPAERTKSKKAHYVYLPPMAVQLVEEAIAASTSKKYVFGHLWNQKLGKPIDGATLCKKFTAFLKGEGIPGVIHVTRHTVATSCLKLGIDYNIVEAMLNHSPTGTGAIYTASGGNYPKLQKAWTAWASHIEKVVSGKNVEADNILQMFHRKAG